MGFARIHPVVVRASILARLGADKRQMLDTSDIGGVRTVQIAIRVGRGIQLDKIAGADHGINQARVFGV
jgi:hypothetical protein